MGRVARPAARRRLTGANGAEQPRGAGPLTVLTRIRRTVEAAGFEAHLAEPTDTQAALGRKHRAKTDRSAARLLRDLLAAGELPESWIPRR